MLVGYVDELKVYRGDDFSISPHIKIHQATLGEICDYGEIAYYNMVLLLTATPQSLKAELDEVDVDYTQITPYELFYLMIYKIFDKEKTQIIFGDLDFSKFELDMYDDGSVYLKQIIKVVEGKTIKEETIIIDENVYNTFVAYLCVSHGIERDETLPLNEATKKILIEDAKEEKLINANKPQKSQLKNLISSMINSEGFKYNHAEVWDMKIGAFMDSVKRIQKIKSADLILQSGYSGFGINLQEIDKKKLDWLGELD